MVPIMRHFMVPKSQLWTHPLNGCGVRRQPRAEGARLILLVVEPSDLLPEHGLESQPPHPQGQMLARKCEHAYLEGIKTRTNLDFELDVCRELLEFVVRKDQFVEWFSGEIGLIPWHYMIDVRSTTVYASRIVQSAAVSRKRCARMPKLASCVGMYPLQKCMFIGSVFLGIHHYYGD